MFRTFIENVGQIAHEIADPTATGSREPHTPTAPGLRQGGARINRLYKDRVVHAEIPGLKPLYVNDSVRLLKMTRKEQEQGKIKGLAPKWTKRIYTVLRKTALRKNEFAYRYDIGLPDTYYRSQDPGCGHRGPQSIRAVQGGGLRGLRSGG